MHATSDSCAPMGPRGGGGRVVSAWPARERGRCALTYELGEDGVHGIRDVHPVAAVRMVKVPLNAPAKEARRGQHQAAGAERLGEGGTPRAPEPENGRNKNNALCRPDVELLLHELPRAAGLRAERVPAQVRAWRVRCAQARGRVSGRAEGGHGGAALTELGADGRRLHLAVRRDGELGAECTEGVVPRGGLEDVCGGRHGLSDARFSSAASALV